MNNTKEKGINIKQKITQSILAMVPSIIVVVLTLCLPGVYKGYFEKPVISFETIDDDNDAYILENEFRKVKINLYPQLIVRYKQKVIIVINLIRYYKESSGDLKKEEGKKIFIKRNQESLNIFCTSLKNDIETALCQKYDISTESIDDDLHIYTSIFSVVEYENYRSSNRKIYCILEDNGFLSDYSVSAEEVRNRLYNTEIILDASINNSNNLYIRDLKDKIIEKVDECYALANE